MSTLPLELLLDVAVYLDTEDLLKALLVSKAWHQIITTTTRLWQHPRFTVICSRDPHGGFGLKLSPKPRTVALHLKGFPVLSLHLTVQVIPRLFTCLKLQVPGLLNCINLKKPLHLIFDGVTASDLDLAIHALATHFRANRLSIGTDPTLADLLKFINRLERSLPSSRLMQMIEIYPNLPGHSSFDKLPAVVLPRGTFVTSLHTAPTASLPGFLTMLPSLFDLTAMNFPEQSASINQVVQTGPPSVRRGRYKGVSLFIPDKLIEEWKEWDVRQWDISSFHSLQVSGGSWKSIESSEALALEHLSCQNVWKLVSNDVEGNLPQLASLQLSFNPNGKTTWGNIARFLSSMLAPNIQLIHITFPTESNDGVQHQLLNAAWKKLVMRSEQLKEVTLINYIPSTLSSICQNNVIRRNIDILVLADDILPRNFTTAFVPEKLPRANHLDLSGARFHRKASLEEVSAWITLWTEAGGNSKFLPPKTSVV